MEVGKEKGKDGFQHAGYSTLPLMKKRRACQEGNRKKKGGKKRKIKSTLPKYEHQKEEGGVPIHLSQEGEKSGVRRMGGGGGIRRIVTFLRFQGKKGTRFRILVLGRKEKKKDRSWGGKENRTRRPSLHPEPLKG